MGTDLRLALAPLRDKIVYYDSVQKIVQQVTQADDSYNGFRSVERITTINDNEDKTLYIIDTMNRWVSFDPDDHSEPFDRGTREFSRLINTASEIIALYEWAVQNNCELLYGHDLGDFGHDYYSTLNEGQVIDAGSIEFLKILKEYEAAVVAAGEPECYDL